MSDFVMLFFSACKIKLKVLFSNFGGTLLVFQSFVGVNRYTDVTKLKVFNHIKTTDHMKSKLA